MYAIPGKLKEFRKQKGLTQSQVAEILNMEQTTYGKLELGKNRLRLETALTISEIIEKDISEFATVPLSPDSLSNTSISNGDIKKISEVSYTNFNAYVPAKIAGLLEELLVILKKHL